MTFADASASFELIVIVPVLMPVVDPPLNCTSTSLNLPGAMLMFCVDDKNRRTNPTPRCSRSSASTRAGLLRTRSFACGCDVVFGNAGSAVWNLLKTSRSGCRAARRDSRVPISSPRRRARHVRDNRDQILIVLRLIDFFLRHHEGIRNDRAVSILVRIEAKVPLVASVERVERVFLVDRPHRAIGILETPARLCRTQMPRCPDRTTSCRPAIGD